MRSNVAILGLIHLYVISSLFNNAAVNAAEGSCSCGYYDANTHNLFTESMIVYFNETNSLPIPGLVAETYEHDYEKGWDTQFREGADLSNVEFSNSDTKSMGLDSLELRVSPYQEDHLVVGSSIRTSRQDIQYGSFTSLMRSPEAGAGGGGSALSMALQFNLSQTISTDLQNTDAPSGAFVSMLHSEESPETSRVITYENMTRGSFGEGTISPWENTEIRMDWTRNYVKFYIGGLLARTITKDENDGLFSTPSPFFLKHWSNGNAASSQGPPKYPTTAHVGWFRTFFNSSLMTEDDHVKFGKRCLFKDACLASDVRLRGSSPYPGEALLKWKQKPGHRPTRKLAIWLAVACIALTTFLLVNPFWKRIREKIAGRKTPVPAEGKLTTGGHDTMSALFDSRAATIAGSTNLTPNNRTRAPSFSAVTLYESKPSSSNATPSNQTRPSSITSKHDASPMNTRKSVFFEDIQPSNHMAIKNHRAESGEKGLGEDVSSEKPQPVTKNSSLNNEIILVSSSSLANSRESKGLVTKDANIDNLVVEKCTQGTESRHQQPMSHFSDDAVDITGNSLLDSRNRSSSAALRSSTKLPEATNRVDHLAGLVAVSCLIVTAIHFNLTFVFGDLNPGGFHHYRSEEIARKTFSQIFLNLIWIGPFLMTSTRFLVSSYLRTGDLLPIAQKTVTRTFRLMIPISAMAMLEYFLITCGAINWLEFLPSITWSIWPYAVGYSNFSNFVSEILELAYLIPNAAPLITFNYCTGVLWTIPVQLQGSWLTLLAVIVICEIKTPWKRFGFYAFCIVNHWYAVSWGTYFYLGIMLTDLDVTYNWRKYLHARPAAYYPLLIFFVLLGLAALSVDVVTQWTNIFYATSEYGIHPDPSTGLTISQAGKNVYPPYYLPRINGIAFALGIQAAIELSPFIQKIFSFRVLVWIFPHIFTIYLLHGFVFWSLGSWMCVALAVHGLSYWLNLLIVAISCYTVIAISLPVLTPLLDGLGKSITRDIWQFAHEDPVPRRPTLHPFPPGFLFDRYETPHEGNESKDVKIQNMKDPELEGVVHRRHVM